LFLLNGDIEHRFLLTFDTVDGFEQALTHDGPDTGIFHKTLRAFAVGDRLSILVTIKGAEGIVSLEGRVLWRRIRSGGPQMPAGVFIALVDRDRARLDSIVRYLKSNKPNKQTRAHPRYPVLLPAKYQTSKGEFPSETRNLSRGGAFLRCNGPLLTVGAKFPVILFLDGEAGKGTSLNAKVAWIDYFEDTQGMGVMFDPGQSQLKKVHRLLDKFEKSLRKQKASG
jgi:Tfp pilus assembly protein PilZ